MPACPAEDGYDQVSDLGRDRPALRVNAGAQPKSSDFPDRLSPRVARQRGWAFAHRRPRLLRKLHIIVHRLKGSYSGEHPLRSDEVKALVFAVIVAVLDGSHLANLRVKKKE